MAVGRLAWRTPVGGLLWEVWGRYKFGVKYQVAALLFSLAVVYWRQHGLGGLAGEIAMPIPIYCFVGVYIHLLSCFGYLDVGGGDLNMGFPRRLFLKPLKTSQLAAIPMLVGGIVVLGVFAMWALLVLRQVAGFVATPWFGACLLSFFWSIQAAAWILPESQAGRSFILLLIAGVNLLVGLLPLLPAPPPVWVQWTILGALLGSAVLAGTLGLQLIRQGHWDGPSRITQLWQAWRPAPARVRRKKLQSAFRAQFWLEWQRQGLLLPFLTGAMILVFPLILWCAGDRPDEEQTLGVVGTALAVPLVFSSVLAGALAKFDLGRPGNDLPVYIAIRPMTNGGFVMAKLAMAGAAGALTWLVVVLFAGLWFSVWGNPELVARVRQGILANGPLAMVMGCLPLLLLLVLFTWKNLVSGIGLGLAGNPWLTAAFGIWQVLLLIGLGGVGTALKFSPDFKPWLVHRIVHWGPVVLIAGLVLKLTVACAAFVWSCRRNAITPGAIGWIVGSWAGGGLFTAAYGALVCLALSQPEAWPWVALAGFLLMPLAGLALAPLAIGWNRHR